MARKVNVYTMHPDSDKKIYIMSETVADNDDVLFDGGFVKFYRDFNIFKLYKAYKVRDGEFVELEGV